jgi:hypothetical protein
MFVFTEHVHEAWTGRRDMQRGQATWICSIDMQRSDMDIKEMASIMDIWGEHLAWT